MNKLFAKASFEIDLVSIQKAIVFIELQAKIAIEIASQGSGFCRSACGDKMGEGFESKRAVDREIVFVFQ